MKYFSFLQESKKIGFFCFLVLHGWSLGAEELNGYELGNNCENCPELAEQSEDLIYSQMNYFF